MPVHPEVLRVCPFSNSDPSIARTRISQPLTDDNQDCQFTQLEIEDRQHAKPPHLRGYLLFTRVTLLPCKWQVALFVVVGSRCAKGVKTSVHYIAFWQSAPLRNNSDLLSLHNFDPQSCLTLRGPRETSWQLSGILLGALCRIFWTMQINVMGQTASVWPFSVHSLCSAERTLARCY